MNIATGLLEAPVEKTASGFMEALEHAGTALAKFRGASGEAIPYALSAGIGAGAQQATNRLLRGKLVSNPKLKKVLELGTATALGGGAGLAGALAAPLNKHIAKNTGGQAARHLAELTAMGAGAELALSPVAQGLLGSKPIGALETMGKLVGGGGLAFGGQVARDSRQLDILREMIRKGDKLPKMIDPRIATMGTRDVIKSRYNQLGIPTGGLLGASGAALLATGNPMLGASALLAAPFKNETSSKYIGDIVRELRAGVTKAKDAAQTKDTLDGLYKKSSLSIKLAAPVYRTRPVYCLDAPTHEKLGFFATAAGLAGAYGLGKTLFKGTGKQIAQGFRGGTGVGGKLMGALKGTGQAAQQVGANVAEGTLKATDVAGNLYQRGQRYLSAPLRQQRSGAKQVLRAQRQSGQAPNLAEAEAALSKDLSSTTAATANPIAPAPQIDPNQRATGIGDLFSRQKYKERFQGAQARAERADPLAAQTQEGQKAFEALGSGEARAVDARNRYSANPNATRDAAESYILTPAAPTAPNYQVAGQDLSQMSAQELNNLSNITQNKLTSRFKSLEAKVKGGNASPAEIAERNYLGTFRDGQGNFDPAAARNAKGNIERLVNDVNTYANYNAQVGSIPRNPLTAPVQRSTTKAPLSGGASEMQQAIGGQSPVSLPRLTPRTQDVLSSRGPAQDVLAQRGLATEGLGDAVVAIEGPGGFKNPVTRNIEQAERAAMDSSGVRNAAEANSAATEAFITDAKATFSGSPAEELKALEESIAEVSIGGQELTSANVISAMERRLGSAPTLGPKQLEVALANTPSGQALSGAQKELSAAVGRYEQQLSSTVTKDLNRAIDTGIKDLNKELTTLKDSKQGIIGRRTSTYTKQDLESFDDVAALVEQRVSSLNAGTVKERHSAAELLRMTKEIMKGGNPQEINALRDQLVKQEFSLASFGNQNRFTSLLNDPARARTFKFNDAQQQTLEQFADVGGVGSGNVAERVQQVFSPNSMASPGTGQGRALQKALTEGGNADMAKVVMEAGGGGAGPVGQSAATKLVAGEQTAAKYTMAEINALKGRGKAIATPSVPSMRSATGADITTQVQARVDQVFNTSAKNSIGENLGALDREIAQLERSLQQGGRTQNTNAIQGNLDILRAARQEAGTHASGIQSGMQAEFDMATKARSSYYNEAINTRKYKGIRPRLEASKIEVPKSVDMEAARVRAGNPEIPIEQRREEVLGLAKELRASKANKGVPAGPDGDLIVIQRLINEGAVTGEELLAMGGVQGLTSSLAPEVASRGGSIAGLATLGAAGLGTAAVASRKPGPATQARQQVGGKVVQSSWGLSPLDAPIMRSKISAEIKPIPLKATQPKLPKVDKLPAQSLLTATVEGQEQAMKMSSFLSAPVGGM